MAGEGEGGAGEKQGRRFCSQTPGPHVSMPSHHMAELGSDLRKRVLFVDPLSSSFPFQQGSDVESVNYLTGFTYATHRVTARSLRDDVTRTQSDLCPPALIFGQEG